MENAWLMWVLGAFALYAFVGTFAQHYKWDSFEIWSERIFGWAMIGGLYVGGCLAVLYMLGTDPKTAVF